MTSRRWLRPRFQLPPIVQGANIFQVSKIVQVAPHFATPSKKTKFNSELCSATVTNIFEVAGKEGIMEIPA